MEGVSENLVRVRYADGSWQEIMAEDMDGIPKVNLRTFADEICVYENAK